ncbi:DUF7848 domain-containing protein [Streptomyces sp. NPDC004682]
MSRSKHRFVDYDVKSDPMADLEFSSRCVWGPETECGAESGAKATEHEVYAWKIQHTKETRHTRYRNSTHDYEVWTPKEPVPEPKPVPPRGDSS